jgi:hypothetical protein
MTTTRNAKKASASDYTGAAAKPPPLRRFGLAADLGLAPR